MPYPYQLSDLVWGIGSTSASNATGGIWNKLSQRDDSNFGQWAAQAVADATLEFSRDYRFNNLEKNGPVFQLTANQYQYNLSNFLLSGDTIANLVPSFTMYYEANSAPVVGQYNPSVQLKWKTIDALELMFGTPGTPAYWTRYGGQIFVAPVPQQNYYCYMRYQIQHKFSNPAAQTDAWLLPDEWREIAEYAGAERLAINLRMLDYASQYHQILFGDPEFQRSSGGRGQPGLIFRRVSQMESDSTSMMRQIQPAVRRS